MSQRDDDNVRPLRGRGDGPRRKRGGSDPRAGAGGRPGRTPRQRAGGGDGPRRPGPRPAARAGQPGRGARILRWALAILVVVVVILVASNGFFVDLLWFREVGQRAVLLTRVKWEVLTGVVAGLLAFVVVWGNLWIARRVGRNDLYLPFLNGFPDGDPEHPLPAQPTVPHFALRPISLGVAAIVAVLFGLSSAGQWVTVLRWHGRSPFGLKDPLFHRDAAFYVFTMPVLELVLHVLIALVVVSALVTAIAYTAMGVIRYLPAWRIARPAAVHLAGLAAALLVIEAFAYRLRAWNLVTSEVGVATGAGWTDVHARYPGFLLMLLASLVAAVLVVLFARRARWRSMAYLAVAYIGLSIVLGGIVPSVVQKAIVVPNERSREAKVLHNNIRMTRASFNLEKISARSFTDSGTLPADALTAEAGTFGNLRLWSPDVLQKAFQAQQSLHPYYDFNDVDVDRYRLDGRYTQTMLSVREVNPQGVSGNKTWVNQRLQFTHGYGIVGAWPDRVGNQGQPDLFLQDIPPRAATDLRVRQSAIYYGEQPDHYVLANSRQQEFDYPKGQTNRQTRYAGPGGIPVSSFLRRLSLSLKFGDGSLLLSSQVDAKTRLMFRRNIVQRVHELAPFLGLDSDPYPVVLHGRVVWVLDGYTTTDRFPYAQRTTMTDGSIVNYARNSVKATVDAYTGKVVLYAVDDSDPLLRSWRSIFPHLFRDGSKMPAGLRAHLRYPEDLFETQTDMWGTYHMTNTTTFYNKEDLWQVPQVGSTSLSPFYVVAKLPGGTKPEMLLVRPMVPNRKRNMIGYLIARMDGSAYGEMVSYRLPKDALTQGPQQVLGLIKQDDKINQQVKLWDNGTTKAVFGDLQVIPVQHSLLDVLPVYLESTESQQPAFVRVVLVLGEDVAWGRTTREAFANLLAKRGGRVASDGSAIDTGSTDTTGSAGTTSTDTTGTGTTGGTTPGSKLTEQQVLAAVGKHFAAAEACQRRNDFTCSGKELDAIDKLLRGAGVVPG